MKNNLRDCINLIFKDNYLSALILGTVGGYILFIVSDVKSNEPYFLRIREWQTLISSIIALGAAWWTVSTLKKQIDQDKNIFLENRYRKSLAMRAQMPEALCELSNFCKMCFNSIKLRNIHKNLMKRSKFLKTVLNLLIVKFQYLFIRWYRSIKFIIRD